MTRRDGLFGLLSILILSSFMPMGPIGPLTGAVLLSIYCDLLILIKKQRKYYTSHLIEGGDAGWKTIVTAVFKFRRACGVLQVLVYSAGDCRASSYSEMIVGLFAPASGTRLAELVVAVNSAMKHLCSSQWARYLGVIYSISP